MQSTQSNSGRQKQWTGSIAGMLLVVCAISGCATAQANREKARSPVQQPPVSSGGVTTASSLQAGPVDSSERVAPGPIDADATPGFTETRSGLKYRILRKSNRQRPREQDEVVVHYKGWLDNGTIFDSSYRRGKTISFPLREVVAGWTEGLQLVGTGGMIELEIPYALGYGPKGNPRGGIPPKATLHFIVELVEVLP